MKYPTLVSLFLCLLIVACKKDEGGKNDKTAPKITLNGNSSIDLPKGVTASDPGATASDDKDGDITAKITSNWEAQVNIDMVGTYMVTYNVRDNAGNEASSTRTVNVKFSDAGRYGDYNTTFTNEFGTSNVFTSTVSPGDNPNQFIIYPFRSHNVAMKVNVNGLFGNQLSYSQSAYGNTYTGVGTIDGSGNTISLTFTVYTPQGAYPHTSTLTKK